MQPLCLLALLSSAALIPGSLEAPASSLLTSDEDLLKQTFLAQCNHYISKRHPELFSVKPSCDSLWNKFQTAALKTGGCYQDKAEFDSLMNLADHSLPKDKVIFWSGVQDLIPKLRDHSNLGWFMLEDTLMGFALDRLSWCGEQCRLSSVSTTVRSTSVSLAVEPSVGSTLSSAAVLRSSGIPNNVMSVTCDNFTMPFFIAASEWLALKALGKAAVILNASQTPPFRETSIFAQYELPLISSSRVNFFNIYMLNSLEDASTTDSCSLESVIKLQQVLRDKEIPCNCIENPPFLVAILCLNQTDAKLCTLIKDSNGLQPSLLWIVNTFFLAVVATQNTR